MTQQRQGAATEMQNTCIPRWRELLVLLAPSALLLPVLAFYLRFKGTPHFFLHTLIGWDVDLVLLLALAYTGLLKSYWDGFLPLALALYAMSPTSSTSPVPSTATGCSLRPALCHHCPTLPTSPHLSSKDQGDAFVPVKTPVVLTAPPPQS